MYGVFIFPAWARRRIWYLVNCNMRLCQFRPLYGRRLTTEAGSLCARCYVFTSRIAGSSSHLEEPPGLSGSHRKWRFRRTTPINTTLALLRRNHAVMEIKLCQMSQHSVPCRDSWRKSSCAGVNYLYSCDNFVVRDSVVGIATRYGLDGPGIEYRWRRDFPHPSRPALEPTPRILYNGYRVSFPGVKRPGRGVKHSHPV